MLCCVYASGYLWEVNILKSDRFSVHQNKLFLPQPRATVKRHQSVNYVSFKKQNKKLRGRRTCAFKRLHATERLWEQRVPEQTWLAVILFVFFVFTSKCFNDACFRSERRQRGCFFNLPLTFVIGVFFV